MKVKRDKVIKLIKEELKFEMSFKRKLEEARKFASEAKYDDVGDKPDFWPEKSEKFPKSYPKWNSEDNSVKKWEMKNMIKHIRNIGTTIKLMDVKNPVAKKLLIKFGSKLIDLGIPALVKGDKEKLEELDSFLKMGIKNWADKEGYSQLATRLYPIVAFIRDKYNTGQNAGNDVKSKRTQTRDDQPTAVSPSRNNQVTKVNES